MYSLEVFPLHFRDPNDVKVMSLLLYLDLTIEVIINEKALNHLFHKYSDCYKSVREVL
jgi:hypothetical protein